MDQKGQHRERKGKKALELVYAVNFLFILLEESALFLQEMLLS